MYKLCSKCVQTDKMAESCSHLRSAAMFGKTLSACSASKSASGRIPVFTAQVKSPAAFAARVPKGAFSTTIHSSFRKPERSQALRYGSGFGLPYFTSKAEMMPVKTPSKVSLSELMRFRWPEPVTTQHWMPFLCNQRPSN